RGALGSTLFPYTTLFRSIAFYQEAFGATVREEPHKAPDGKVVHSEVWFGDSVVFMTDEGDDRNGVAPSSIGGLVTAVMALNVPRSEEHTSELQSPCNLVC